MTPLSLIGVVALAALLTAGPARAEPTPPQAAAAQPTLPTDVASPGKPGSPVVDQIVDPDRPPLVVRKTAVTAHRWSRRVRLVGTRVPRSVQRPALAGVELLAPLPPPGEPPHFVVPLPAYPLETIATHLTMPLPQIVCHPVRRDPSAPAPHLYREVPLACEPDDP